MAVKPEDEQALRGFAEELGVDPDLVLAVAEQESGGLSDAVSPRGARGLMQIMPRTSRELEPKFGADKRRQGVGYLQELERRFSDVPEEETRSFTLAAYNAGPGRVRQAQAKAKRAGLDETRFENVAQFLPGETQRYIPGVTGRLPQADPDPIAELERLAAEEEEAAAPMTVTRQPPPEPARRGLGESFLSRTAGRFTEATDKALGGLPSTLGAVAGAASAGDQAGIQAALEEGGGTKDRLMGVGLGLLELALTSKFPGASAATGGIGAVTEATTGSREAGDVAEIASGIAPAVRGLAKTGAGGARKLLGAPSTKEIVTEGLGSQKTAQQVGKELQAPGSGAGKVITDVTDEASVLYKTAQAVARGKNLKVPASDQAIQKASREAIKTAKEAGRPVSGATRRVLAEIKKAGLGKKSKMLTAEGKPMPRAPKDISVSDLIDMQSNLRREIYKLDKKDPARKALINVSVAIDDAMLRASKGTPEVFDKLNEARAFFRDTTIPTRKTMARVLAAEEPETAARVLTQRKKPSRFERFAARGKDVESEGVRSAFFNDLVEGATEGGNLNLRKLASALEKAEGGGQLKSVANTKSRQQTIKAINKAAKIQTAAGQMPIVVGGTGLMTGGILGVAGGFTMGRIIKTSMQNERASRALLRMASARQGTPGWKKARDVLYREVRKGAPAVRSGVGIAQEEE